MCGYCMESSIFAERLAMLDPDGDYQFAPDLLSLRLQEAIDWRLELKAFPEGMCDSVASVALCRWWMDRITGADSHALFECGFDAKLVDGLHAGAGSISYPPEWVWLGNWNGPLPDPLPIAAAQQALDAYISEALEASANHGRPSNTWVHLMCALEVLVKNSPSDSRLRQLALTEPAGSVGFLGAELWLQRRAVAACIADQGAGFLIENLEVLRNEVIASVAMQKVLGADDLQVLLDSLAAHESSRMNIDGDELRTLVRQSLHDRSF